MSPSGCFGLEEKPNNPTYVSQRTARWPNLLFITARRWNLRLLNTVAGVNRDWEI
jgi:hypothetical protein